LRCGLLAVQEQKCNELDQLEQKIGERGEEFTRGGGRVSDQMKM
jgi:hypothetical protein